LEGEILMDGIGEVHRKQLLLTENSLILVEVQKYKSTDNALHRPLPVLKHDRINQPHFLEIPHVNAKKTSHQH